MKKLFSLSLLLLFLLCGCESALEEAEPAPPLTQPEPYIVEDPAPAPFTLAWYPDYSMHPVLSTNRVNLDLAPLLYEGLFAVDAQFQAIPVLCSSYQTDEEGLNWSFVLREGVTFSDGTPLTGEIAARALQTALRSNRYAARLGDVRTVSAEGNTVLLRLDAPNASLPVLLDIPIALDESARPLGTGPFLLHEEEGQAELLPRSPETQLGDLSAVRLYPIRQTDELLAGFSSGEITLLETDLTATNALGYSGSFELWDFATSDLIYLGFRCDKGFCRDPEIRAAIARAVDREAIVTVSYAGHAVSTCLSVHPDSAAYRPGLAQQADYAPQILAELLTQIKLPAAPLRLLVNSENNAKVATAQTIAEQLQSLGLPVEVVKQPWDEFLSSLRAEDFDLYLGEVLLRSDFSMEEFLSGSLNYGGLNGRDYAEALYDWRLGEYGTLEAQLLETAPLVPICFKNHSVLTQWGRLSGLAPRQGNIFSDLSVWRLDQ